MRYVLTLFLLLASSSPTFAAPIIYTYSGVFSGSIGNSSFSNQPTTIIGIGNTENVVAFYGLITSPLSALYITIASIGTGAFLGYNNLVYTDVGPDLGVNGTNSASVQDFLGSEYSLGTSYDLKSNLGPLPVYFRAGGSGHAETTIGSLILSTGEATFASSVPEPTSMALLLFSVTGALTLRLQKALR